jgi:hypothetical protein
VRVARCFQGEVLPGTGGGATKVEAGVAFNGVLWRCFR